MMVSAVSGMINKDTAPPAAGIEVTAIGCLCISFFRECGDANQSEVLAVWVQQACSLSLQYMSF